MSEFKKQHPAAAVDQLFMVIRKNLVTFIILIILGTRDTENSIFLYIFYGSLVLSLVSGVLSWWLFRYRVINNELQIRKGIIVRKNLYLTKDRIQVIDITEGIVQRIFGLVKLEVKTAGSGTESATIHAITREEAEKLRAELRGNNKTTPADTYTTFESEAVADSKKDALVVTKRDLVLAAMTSGSFGLIASILGAVFGQLNFLFTDENIEYLSNHLPNFGNVTLIAAGVAAILIVSWLLSFIGVILKYYNFEVQRTENELVVTSGLIERKHITIPYNRIQAVRFVEGVIRQPFGYGMLFVESAGFEVKEAERSITLLPYISKDDLSEFFARFLPEYTLQEMDITPPEKSKWRYLRRPNYWLFIIVPIIWWFLDLNWTVAAFIPLLTYLGWLQLRDNGIRINQDGQLSVRYRLLARTTAFIHRKRIMAADMHINPFQSIKNLADLTITAASGAKGIGFRVRDLSQNDLLNVFAWISDKPTVDDESL